MELELIKFPNGKHDDMIDALASCVAISQIQSNNSVQDEQKYEHEMDQDIYRKDDYQEDSEQNLDNAY